jgi:ketosteroid isomerase-like protein
MKSSPRIVLALLILLAAAGAILARPNQSDVDSILAADAAWMKVYHAKDLAKSVAFCDEQGSMLVPNAPIATGKEALSKAIAADFATNDLTWHADKAGVARSGDLGYTSGSYDADFKDATGKTVHDRGKFLTVWKKQSGGSWKVLLDMDNSDGPQ